MFFTIDNHARTPWILRYCLISQVRIIEEADEGDNEVEEEDGAEEMSKINGGDVEEALVAKS